MQPYRMVDPYPVPRRRKWPVVLLLVLLVAGGWCGVWVYAAARAGKTITGWLNREARFGRVYTCGSRHIGGFPFRFEARCDGADAVLGNMNPPLALKLHDVKVTAQVFDPTLLTSEFTGPLLIAESGNPPSIAANWSLARTSVRGNPRAPEQVSVLLDHPYFDRITEAGKERAFTGDRVEAYSRMISGSPFDHPVLGFSIRTTAAASAPGLHTLATAPIDADVDMTLYGLKDLAIKPWAVRLREIQEAGGRIEVKKVRIKQGAWLMAGAGNLSLTSGGGVDGQLAVTVAGLDQLLQDLGVDYLARSEKMRTKVDTAVNVLNQLVPGLGDSARKNVGAGLAAGASLLGEKAELEGLPAVKLPLRFHNGAAYLGPLPIGQVPPLF